MYVGHGFTKYINDIGIVELWNGEKMGKIQSIYYFGSSWK